MNIAIIGSRGIPARYGGFETFASEISVIFSQAGHDVTVIGEKGNTTDGILPTNVKVKESAFKKSTNPVLFYLDSFFRSSGKFDAIIACGVGAAPFYFFLKRKNTFLLTNVDGMEQLRGKFSFIKKLYVKISQWFTAKCSDIIIADAYAVGNFWKNKFDINEERLRVLAYGASTPLPFRTSDLDNFRLVKKGYYLIIARLVPENHILEMIRGFRLSGSKKKLLLVGGLEQSGYVKTLKSLEIPGLHFADAVYDKQILDSLRSGAFAYLHGHSVGGTNPSLLEAMAASCVCICHDNVFNHEITSSKQLYFRDEKDLALRIDELEKMAEAELSAYGSLAVEQVRTIYSWEKVGLQYLGVLKEADERKRNLQTRRIYR